MDGERPSYGPRLQRLLFFVLGSIFVALATLGVLLPLLPTTPFLLLAAACYARSSSRFHSWLLANRIFGPTIRQWQESWHRSDKVMAIFMLMATLGSSIIFFVRLWPVKLLLIAVAIWVIHFCSFAYDASV